MPRTIRNRLPHFLLQIGHQNRLSCSPPRYSPRSDYHAARQRWGHSRNQTEDNLRADATTLLDSVERCLRPNDYALRITYNSISSLFRLM